MAGARLSPGASIYLILAIVVLTWGGNYIGARIVAQHMPPFAAILLRTTITTAVLVLGQFLLGAPWPRPTRRDAIVFGALGVTGIALSGMFFYLGLQTATAAEAGLIMATVPLLGAGIAALLLHERITRRQLVALVISIGGAGLIVVGKSPEVAFAGPALLGDLFLLGCAVSWAGYSVGGRLVLDRYPPFTVVTYSTIVGAIALIPSAVIENAWTEVAVAPPTAWLSLVYMSVIVGCVSYVLWYRAIGRLGATRGIIFYNLVPVVAVILAWQLLGETLLPIQLIGGTLVVGSVCLANWTAIRPVRPLVVPTPTPSSTAALVTLKAPEDAGRTR